MEELKYRFEEHNKQFGKYPNTIYVTADQFYQYESHFNKATILLTGLTFHGAKLAIK